MLSKLPFFQVSTTELTKFLEDFNDPIYQMSISEDINDKKGAIYAISKYVKSMI